MTVDDYRRALEAAQDDLQHAVQERDKWIMTVLQLQDTISALSKRCAFEEQQEIIKNLGLYALSLSETVKTILRMNKRPLTAVEVRDALWASGFDLGQYANALALVTSTLERLFTSGFAIRRGRRPATYEWPEVLG